MRRLSDLFACRLRLEVTCRACGYAESLDPRPLLAELRFHGRPDDLASAARLLACTRCAGDRLTLRPARPPLADRSNDGHRYCLTVARRPAGPMRFARIDAEFDAVDAGEASLHAGQIYLNPLAAIARLPIPR